MASKRILSIIDQFIGDHVLVFIQGLDSSVTLETGEQNVVPYIMEGILYDHDIEYILLGDDSKTQFTLINKNSIAKIDISNSEFDAMMDPSKPQKKEMN